MFCIYYQFSLKILSLRFNYYPKKYFLLHNGVNNHGHCWLKGCRLIFLTLTANLWQKTKNKMLWEHHALVRQKFLLHGLEWCHFKIRFVFVRWLAVVLSPLQSYYILHANSSLVTCHLTTSFVSGCEKMVTFLQHSHLHLFIPTNNNSLWWNEVNKFNKICL